MINRKVKQGHSGQNAMAQGLARPLRAAAVVAGCLLLAAQVFASTLVNINTADAATIAQSLQGIGPVKAQAIVDYRKQNGLFKTPDDIMKVTGIGQATFELLKSYLSVGAVSGNSSKTSSLATNPVTATKTASSSN